jgi:quercetin dioxygenase-like cupin family protein
VQQALSPGDSIISLHGAATFTAGPLPQQQQQQQEANPTQQQQHSSSPAWSQLLGWLQQLHAKQQQQANPTSRNAGADAPLSQAAAAAAVAAPPRASSSSSNQLVMLQLLLPSELLTGQMLTHHPGHCHAVAQQLPWGDSAGGLYPNAAAAAAAAGASGRVGQRDFCDVTHAGSIHAAQVCGLLVDAGLSPPATQTQQQQQQQQTEGPFLHSTTQQMPTQVQQQQQQIVPATTNSNTGTAAPAADTADLSSKGTAATITTTSSDSSSDGGSPGRVLPSLNQQQVLKRALSEVGAFRLPHQTNRLALLFGPHSAPAVCCSFGVEVFEPGHVTPLHIHNTAHELFFVLAGKGEAVFRPGTAAAAAGTDDLSSSSSGAQRVVMSPGDVAVFPPGVVHGVDTPGSSQLYCLQMMLPNESFVEWVRSGEEAGRLDVAAVQRLAAAASCG